MAGSSNNAMNAVEMIRHQIIQRGAHSLKGIIRRFGAYDLDHDRKLSLQEFQEGLARSGINITGGEAAEAFRAFDKDNSGSIDANELAVGKSCLHL